MEQATQYLTLLDYAQPKKREWEYKQFWTFIKDWQLTYCAPLALLINNDLQFGSAASVWVLKDP